jgi:hypothetical protein
MMRLFGLTLAVTASLSIAAMAAPERERIRGTVSSVGTDSIAVHTMSGEDVTIALGSGTKYLEVVKSSMGEIEKDSYVGTATKNVGSNLVALEVVLFPASMRGVGDGHYAWDPIPDSTVAGGATTPSMMTNGHVATVSSMMTNGNVAAASTKDGAKELTVAYKDGQQTIVVPSTAPIVTFKPGSMSDVTKGASVFIIALKDEGKITATTIAVGMDGGRPPM